MYKRGDLVLVNDIEGTWLGRIVKRESDGLYQIRDVKTGLIDKNMSYYGGFGGCLKRIAPENA